MSETVRVDRWLWAARFYKTRSQATEACREGRIKREGTALKSAASLRVGDRLEIPSHDRLHLRQIEVVALLSTRVGAPEARSAYLDHTTAEVLEKAAQRRLESKTERSLRHPDAQGRMTKKLLRAWKKGLHQ